MGGLGGPDCPPREVLGEIHRSHPTLADLTLDTVAAFEGSVQAGDGVGHGLVQPLPSAGMR